ncbi:ABC transporter permease [Microbispora sp. H10830]|uniref:ABC transporter permease n=1 Tax=Microbispora sp. H10830 TaxID=2729109 RepID=UPI0015FEC5D6|nr:ABC transporter permease [Microbispora sp. H10830]
MTRADHHLNDIAGAASSPVTKDDKMNADTPVPFRRLLAVEARKLVDTRSGKIISLIMVGLVIASVVARGAVVGPKLQTLVGTAGIALGTLLPVLGILTVTGERAHRTALTTFVLEPRRHRVLAAKCLPPLLAAVALSLFAMLVAVPATAVVSEVRNMAAVWEVQPLGLLGWTGGNVLVAAAGLALGALLLNAPAAIVINFSAPVLWAVVGRLGSVGATLAEWLDLNTTATPLMSGDMTWSEGARLATSVVFWIVIPMAVGLVRVLREEVT